jgi:hypothetical protein
MIIGWSFVQFESYIYLFIYENNKIFKRKPSKYECWVIDLIMPLFFFGFSLAFLYHDEPYHYEM